MRTKNFLIVLCCVVITSIIFIIFGPAGQQNDSFRNIVTQTHEQFKEFQENLRAFEKRALDVGQKYLTQLEFMQHSFNGSKLNFSIVTYAQNGQSPLVILLSQNIASKFPNEFLIIYDLGLSEEDSRLLNGFCNSSKCAVINFDLSNFPSFVMDQRMHVYRSLIIKDALLHSKQILFTENYIRFKATERELNELKVKSLQSEGVLGWTTAYAVSSRTHPKMFRFFETDADDFLFSRMVKLDVIFFTNTTIVNSKILLPWIKCCLTLECIDPIGAQSEGCKFNKKPQFRYSGCHSYDSSAFNIVLGLTWRDESRYSISGDISKFLYMETLEQATKNFESKRKNVSESSDRSFTEE